MADFPLPENEDERIQRLYDYGILDTESDAEYERIASLVAKICETPISLVSFVDADRQWFKAHFGIVESEYPRNIAFCAYTILSDSPMIVSDALADERFRDNPLVLENPKIRFYAGVPLKSSDGYNVGTLCAIDRQPRQLKGEQQEALEVLARHVEALLELRAKNQRIVEQNQRLEELSRIKSLLMSVITHDVRSPLVNTGSLISLLSEGTLDAEEEATVLSELKEILNSAEYMLKNVVTWSAREMSDTPFEFVAIDPRALAEEVADSVRDVIQRKGNTLNLNGAPTTEVNSDRQVLVFILWNLLGNANKFTADGAITLTLADTPRGVAFHVSDSGIGIDPEGLERLFNWDKRRAERGTEGERGAGIGLLLCHDFAERIGASLSAESTVGEGSTFTLEVT